MVFTILPNTKLQHYRTNISFLTHYWLYILLEHIIFTQGILASPSSASWRHITSNTQEPAPKHLVLCSPLCTTSLVCVATRRCIDFSQNVQSVPQLGRGVLPAADTEISYSDSGSSTTKRTATWWSAQAILLERRIPLHAEPESMQTDTTHAHTHIV